MKFRVITFGCQMNQSDSQRLAGFLSLNGCKETKNIEKADLIIVNGCSVRQTAVDRLFGFNSKFKELKIKNKGLKTILTGCVLEKDKRKLEKVFDHILTINNLELWQKTLNIKTAKKKKDFLSVIPKYQSRFSALVPISFGCNNFCSYCAVPFAKGKETNRPAKEIIKEINCLINKNYKEIWLLGQNVNSYKSKIGVKTIDFSDLIKIIEKIPNDFWIRFTSSHPKDFSEKLIKVMAKSKKITPYLNLPMQSGDDSILRKMNRPYNARQYQLLVKKIRKAIPEITLSTDIIVGFPSETKKQFLNTKKLFSKIGFDMAYISQYSPRPMTKAYKMKDSVSKKEKKSRWLALNEILKESAEKRNKKFLNKILTVLPEKYKNGFLEGKSFEYKTVRFKGKKNMIGKFIKVKIIETTARGLKGGLIEQ